VYEKQVVEWTKDLRTLLKRNIKQERRKKYITDHLRNKGYFWFHYLNYKIAF